MKIYSLVIAVLIILISCDKKPESQEASQQVGEDTTAEIQTNGIDSTMGKTLIANFYRDYYTTPERKELKTDYLTQSLVDFLQGPNKQEYVLNYDPFINSNVYDPETIKSTFKVKANPKNKSEFEVELQPTPDAKTSTIELELSQNPQGVLRINKVLSDGVVKE